jgi:hypothetical protein
LAETNPELQEFYLKNLHKLAKEFNLNLSEREIQDIPYARAVL